MHNLVLEDVVLAIWSETILKFKRPGKGKR